jgi:hypothetical protein
MGALRLAPWHYPCLAKRKYQTNKQTNKPKSNQMMKVEVSKQQLKKKKMREICL